MNLPNQNIRFRNTVRLKGYDYTQAGAYFITIVTQHRLPYFGWIENQDMILNEIGQIAKFEWFKNSELRANLELIEDEVIIMPNHLHGILRISTGSEDKKTIESFGKPNNGSIPTIIGAYKAAVSRAVHKIEKYHNLNLWQENYYEHIIRDEKDLTLRREYILKNPLSWLTDEENL